MTNYITLHASAYPPPTWAFLSESRPSQTSNNELDNHLSKTATVQNVARMSRDVEKVYRRRHEFAFEDAAEVVQVLENAGLFVREVDELSRCPMKTIPEEDESGTAQPDTRRPNETEIRQIREAIRNMEFQRSLLNSIGRIKDSYRARLMDIHTVFHDFVCTNIGEHPRPRWAEICRINKEVHDHVAQVAQNKRQVTSDVAQLRKFLREQLFDEYCLMRDTPLEMKDQIWIHYGKYLTSRLEIGNRETGERLERMIDASGLDRVWIIDHIEDYHNGNGHIGAWQRFAQQRRWKELATKFARDIEQLEKINEADDSSDSRRCRIMRNLQDTRRQFFTRLDGADDFELSERAKGMDDESYESSSSSSSSASSSSRASRRADS